MMSDITTHKDIGGIVPLPFFGGITPLCVPMQLNGSFREEIIGKFSVSVNSLWERLGLVFLYEEPTAAQQSENRMVVNNFSSKLILQLLNNKNIRKLVETHQLGFVYSEEFIRQAERRQNLTEQRLTAEITERIMQTERISAQLNAFSALLTQARDESCTVQMMFSLLQSVMQKHIGEKSLTSVETQIFGKLEQRLGSSDKLRERELYTVIRQLRSQDSAPDELRSSVISAAKKYNGNASRFSDSTIAAELAAEAAEKSDPAEISAMISQAVRELDTRLVNSSTEISAEHFRTDEKQTEKRVFGIVRSINEQNISRSVTELLHLAADAPGESLHQRISESLGKLGNGEINRRLRAAYEHSRSFGESAKTVSKVANEVVHRITEQQKLAFAMKNSAEDMRGAVNSVSVGEGKVLPTEQNSYISRSGDVYLNNTTENNSTSAEGKVLPSEQNSYNVSRLGDVYLSNT
ncbi:MAG: hypothetical protein ACI4KA_05885, partial [Oscillospiraceae bacterium]